jgi:hypothetical protein
MRAKKVSPRHLTTDSSLSRVPGTEYLLGIWTRPLSAVETGTMEPNSIRAKCKNFIAYLREDNRLLEPSDIIASLFFLKIAHIQGVIKIC